MFEDVLVPELPAKPSELDTYTKTVVYLTSRSFQMQTYAERQQLGGARWAAWSLSRLLSLAARERADDHILLAPLQTAFDLMRDYPTLVSFEQTDLKQGYYGTVYGQPALFHASFKERMTGLLWLVGGGTKLHLMWDTEALAAPTSWHEFLQFSKQPARKGIFS